MRMRSALFPVLVTLLPLGVQCSSSTSDDSPGAGASGMGQGGAGGAAHGGTAGKAGAAGKGSAGTFGEAGGSNVGGAAGEGGSSAGEGGQPPEPMAGSGGAGKGGSGGGAGTGAGGKAGAGGTGGAGGTTSIAGSGGSGGNASSGGNAGTGGGPSTPPPIAHFGQMRFVNLAPSSVPLDLCVKKTGTANYPATPILQGSGIAAGVPYGSQSAYVDVAISAPPDIYDFVMVAGSASNCDPPWYGAFGSVSFNPASSTTVAIFQSYFTGSGNYSGAVFSDGQGQTALTGNVRLFYAANANGFSAAVDFHALRAGATDQTWYSNFMIGFASAFHSAPAGSYDFRALKAGTLTVVADKPGTAVAADNPLDLFLYQSEAAKQVLLGCSSRPEASVAVCAR